MSVRARGPPAFSALDCMELSNCHAKHRFTITLATYCPQYRRSHSLVDHWHCRICPYLPVPARFINFLGFFGYFFTICCYFLALVGHVFAISDETEVPLRVQLCVCMYVCRYVDIYPDDTRTVPVSTSLHVYWCGNVGAQSRSVTTVSTNKHQQQQTVYSGALDISRKLSQF